MSEKLIEQLSCDWPGCVSRLLPGIKHDATWLRDPTSGRDYCPRHWHYVKSPAGDWHREPGPMTGQPWAM